MCNFVYLRQEPFNRAVVRDRQIPAVVAVERVLGLVCIYER
jgi:hypothetical protein